MPGPMFPKDLLLEGAECEVDGLMAIIRREKRLKSALCCSDANPNDGEAADSGQVVMQVKKKKRKKRSKTSLSSNDKAQEHNNKVRLCESTPCSEDANCGADYCLIYSLNIMM